MGFDPGSSLIIICYGFSLPSFLPGPGGWRGFFNWVGVKWPSPWRHGRRLAELLLMLSWSCQGGSLERRT